MITKPALKNKVLKIASNIATPTGHLLTKMFDLDVTFADTGYISHLCRAMPATDIFGAWRSKEIYLVANMQLLLFA